MSGELTGLSALFRSDRVLVIWSILSKDAWSKFAFIDSVGVPQLTQQKKQNSDEASQIQENDLDDEIPF